MPALEQLSGLIGAAHTPIGKGGRVSLEVIPTLADHYLEQGLIGVYLNGSTGQWQTLTIHERMAMTEAWTRAATGRLHIIVHVGGLEIEQSCGLAEHAASCGASAISALMPREHPAESVNDVVSYVAPIAAAADSLPFIYYDIPALTGHVFDLCDLLEVATAKIPTLSGVKYTDGDLTAIGPCLERFGDRVQILMGCDERLLDAVELGVTAAIGSTYNYAAPVYHRVLAAFGCGDLVMARREQDLAAAFVDTLIAVGVLPGGKAIMEWIGIDVGPPRRPEEPLSPEVAKAFQEAISSMDVFASALACRRK